MAGAMGLFKYTSDDGNDYKVKLDASNQTEVGSVAATTEPWYPRGWYPRYVLAQSAAGKRRKVAICDPTQTEWTGADDVIALQEAGVAGTVDYTITGRFGEKRTSRG